MNHDTYSSAAIARRAVLETKAQKAAGRRWLVLDKRDDYVPGYDLDIAAQGTLDGLADSHGIAFIAGGKATLNYQGRRALVEARARKAGRYLATMGRATCNRPVIRPVSYLPEVREVIAILEAA